LGLLNIADATITSDSATVVPYDTLTPLSFNQINLGYGYFLSSADGATAYVVPSNGTYAVETQSHFTVTGMGIGDMIDLTTYLMLGNSVLRTQPNNCYNISGSDASVYTVTSHLAGNLALSQGQVIGPQVRYTSDGATGQVLTSNSTGASWFSVSRIA